ncbi:MAG: hypothetical protein KDB03_22035, partial [Planctomycetales bacterium]|nr:hypothetical protein [Planctomycetales bacterium]
MIDCATIDWVPTALRVSYQVAPAGHKSFCKSPGNYVCFLENHGLGVRKLAALSECLIRTSELFEL